MSPKNNNKQVSAAVRILQQKRDASARAIHLMVKNDSLITYEKAISDQADKGKFPESTFLERKIMSTKTITKRIALVAAAALALGGVSVVTATSANAATTAVTPAAAASVQTVTAVTGTYEIIRIDADTADKYYTITNTGGTVLYPSAASDTTTAISTSAASTLWYSGATPGAAVFGASKTLSFSATSATAGTQTITVVGDSNTGTQTVVITWGAAPSFSATNSWALMSSDAEDSVNTAAEIQTAAIAAKTGVVDDVVVVTKGVALAGTIYVRALNNVSTGTAIGTGSFTAVVSGSGLVTGRDTNGTTAMNTAGLRAATSYPDSAGYAAFRVYGDNTAGTGTITITYTSAGGTTTALGTKTITFSGSVPATMKTSQSGYVAATAGGVLGTNNSAEIGAGAITASLLDSNGNAVAGKGAAIGSSVTEGWYLTSSNTACITTTLADANVTDGDQTTANGVNNLIGTYNLSVTAAAAAVSGCTADVTANFYIAATKTNVAGTPIKFTVGAARITTLAMTTDAATYTPGQKVTVTLTAKDSLGNKVADGYYGIFYDKAAAALAAGTSVNPFVLSASTTNLPFTITAGAVAADQTYLIQDGVLTSTFYAPYTDGAVSLNATLASSNAGGAPSKIASTLYGSKLTGEITINTDSNGTASLALDAANAATDAANNAYDEAQNATQAASDALAAVTALAAQVKSLIASVKKLTAAVAKLKK